MAVLVMVLGVVGGVIGGMPARGQEPEASAVADTAPDTVAAQLIRLRDAEADSIARSQAAGELLASSDPAALRSLIETMQASPGTHAAIVRALASLSGTPPVAMGPVLLDLLPSVDESSLMDFSAALGRYAGGTLLWRIEAVAQDEAATDIERRVAIAALGFSPTRRAAEVLLGLTVETQPPPIREAAFEALIQITGRAELGHDRTAWANWWEQNRDLRDVQWLSRMMEGIGRRTALLSAQQGELVDRLVATQRLLYRATPNDQREPMLVEMLGDRLPAVRLLAVRLVQIRLSNGDAIGPALRERLLARLDDPSPAVIERAVLLLRDLRDADAASRVAGRMAQTRREPDAVLKAYLQLLTAVPDAQAVGPLVPLLSEPGLRDDAAAALASAASAGLLMPEDEAAQRIRQALSGPMAAVSPAVVRLLGAVGGEEEWQALARWLDSTDAEVKQAAALAWANRGRPIRPLMDRVNDPVIQPIAYTAAAAQGDTPATLLALAQTPPEDGLLLAQWQQAILAVAARAPASAIPPVDDLLQPQRSELREQLLSQAIARVQPTGDMALRVDLLLRRAALRLAAGDAASALVDLQVPDLAAGTLTIPAYAQWLRMSLQAYLSLGQLDEALAFAENALQRNGSAQHLSMMARVFIDHAQRIAAAQQPERAQRVVMGAIDLFDDRLTPELSRELEALNLRLMPSPQSSPQPVPAPSAPSAPLSESLNGQRP